MKTLTFFEFERHTAEQKQYGALEDALFAYYDAGYGIDRYFLEDGLFSNEMAEKWLKQNGIAALPFILGDGAIWLEGRYPTVEELIAFFGAPLPKEERYSCCEDGFCTFKIKK